jgi:hypothetical protein
MINKVLKYIGKIQINFYNKVGKELKQDKLGALVAVYQVIDRE